MKIEFAKARRRACLAHLRGSSKPLDRGIRIGQRSATLEEAFADAERRARIPEFGELYEAFQGGVEFSVRLIAVGLTTQGRPSGLREHLA